MPNRIIKDSIHTSEKLNMLTDFQFRLWVSLITYVDDYGRGDARPAVIRGTCFPLRERITNKDIDAALMVLADTGCVSLYKVDGKPYLCFPTWQSHQSIRNVRSKYPAPSDGELQTPDSNLQAIDSNLQAIDSNCTRNPIQSESNSNPNPNPNPNSARTRDADAFAAFAAGDGDLLAVLKDFEKMRRSIRKPMTDRAKQLLVTKLKNEFPPEQWKPVLEQSIVKCWQDVYPLKEREQQRLGVEQHREKVSSDELENLKAIYAKVKGEQP